MSCRLNASDFLELSKKEKVAVLRRFAEEAHVSPRKLLAYYAVAGDDLFLFMVMFADDEIKIPSTKGLKKLLTETRRKNTEEGTCG